MDEDLKALLGYGAACVRVARGGKIPLGNAWNALASSDPATISRWLADGNNVGLLCGSGNLIDIEYDDPAGRETLASLGLLGIDTPTWASSRGEHRLFRLAEPLPPWGWKKLAGIEVRFGGKPAQSVLPPSTHPSGIAYRWLVSPADCEPARIALGDFNSVARFCLKTECETILEKLA
jgi:hypothetical protein